MKNETQEEVKNTLANHPLSNEERLTLLSLTQGQTIASLQIENMELKRQNLAALYQKTLQQYCDCAGIPGNQITQVNLESGNITYKEVEDNGKENA